MVFLVANRTENGALPFTILLFLTLFVCRNESNIQYTTMAGKTKEMSQIKQLLLLKKEEVSNRKAAALVGINKETVNNYVKKAPADELGLEGLLKLDDPVLEHRLKCVFRSIPVHHSRFFSYLFTGIENITSTTMAGTAKDMSLTPSLIPTTVFYYFWRYSQG